MSKNGEKPECNVPECTRSQSDKNPWQLCFKHGEEMKFLLWAMPKIRVQVGQPRLIVPNLQIRLN